ncbi:MAG: magnesium-translocating P-type ATPase, partial [Coriobacteriia bacterium]|nr:magnesium-translocating P-type ATPase [Coriobacteriia bacterium]
MRSLSMTRRLQSLLKFAAKRDATAANTQQLRERLMAGARDSHAELFARYNTRGLEGHSTQAVPQARERYGENIIAHADKLSVFRQLTTAFVNPFTIVLFVIAVISFVTDYLLADVAEKNLTAVIIITAMVAISGALRFMQESRGSKAAEALAEMVETNVDAVRDASAIELPLDEVVVGDIINFAAGDIVPGDMRILDAKDLFVSESSLTGESEAVEKFGSSYEGASNNPLDCNNLAFMGSSIVSGSATALVLAVGADTYFGQIAQAVAGKEAPTSFEKGVNSVSWVLIRFMLIMVPVVLVLTGFTQGDWTSAVLFALSIAVGMTPEMLPMIVSANLAKGAVAMSKKRVIVKNLNSIQNFGSMDVLCTDKTGTLTQDRIILEYSLDVLGNENKRVLRHGFLNSYFQTGFRNLLDRAIIKHGDDHDLAGLRDRYHKVDEIPFDFTRRRMSVVVEDSSGKRQMITKGAIEEMLSVARFVEYHDQVQPLTAELAAEVIQTVNRYNSEGMRVLGIAQRTHNLPEVGEFAVCHESDMVLMGYLAFLDPPKDSAQAALRALNDYGVSVKVLTGDNDAVTRKVCRDVGIDASDMLLGADIEHMSDEQLQQAVA